MEYLHENYKIEIEKFECNTTSPIVGKRMAALRILFFTTGSGVLDIEGQDHVFESPAAVVIPSNQTFLISAGAYRNAGLEIVLPINIYEHFEARGFLQGMRWLIENADCIPISVNRRVEKLVSILVYEIPYKCYYYRLNLIELIIMELLRASNKNIDVLHEIDQSEVKLSQILKSVVEYINENYNKNIHLSSIANKFWVNPSYLSREFKNKLGITMTNFILERKIYAAKNLLLTTNARVGEIAEMVGFKSIAYFGVVFKRVVGLAPNEFRKKKLNVVEESRYEV